MVTQNPSRFDEIADLFKDADPELRMHLLLDYAKKLPPLPERFRAARDAGLNRVPECMTPVFLFVERVEGGRPHVHIDVAEEAPTVKGLLAIVSEVYNTADAGRVAEVPDDLLNRLGLNELIRMNRVIGISAILGRIKRQLAEAMIDKAPDPGS